MKTTVVTILAALSTFGLAGAALAQSNGGAQDNGANQGAYNQGYNQNLNRNQGNSGNQGYNGQGYNRSQANNQGDNGNQGYNRNQAYNNNQSGGGQGAMSAELDSPNTQVRLTQALLQSIGLYNGDIDGLLGQNTHEAIAAFQQRQQLQQTGQLDPATLHAVRRMTAMALDNQRGGMQSGRAASEPQGGDGMQNNNMQNGNMQNRGNGDYGGQNGNP